MCLHSCSSLCTGRSHSALPRSSAGSDTWPACGRSGSSSRRSDTEPSRVRWVELHKDYSGVGVCFFFSFVSPDGAEARRPGTGTSVYSQMGDSVGVGVSTQVPLFSMCPLGQVQTGPLGLSRQSHSHFFLSHGLFTKITHRWTKGYTSPPGLAGSCLWCRYSLSGCL